MVPTSTVTATAPGLTLVSEGTRVTLADGRTVRYVNLDYAAAAPCSVAAAGAVNDILPWYASVHRGSGAGSRRCTPAYEGARRTVAAFVGARPDDHVIFTRNTTDALNLLARALPAETTVVAWASEHHANLLPWPRVLRLPVPSSPEAAIEDLDKALAGLGRSAKGRPALVAVTGASNVTGEVWPLKALTAVAHRHGARIVLDAAQLAAHRPVSLAESGVDYLALSGHKLYAPFGSGVLAGRADWLDAAPPYLAGGGATAHVGDAEGDVRWHDGPARHEAGTPNLLGAVGLAGACAALAASDRRALEEHERVLLDRLRAGLAELDGVAELRTFGPDNDRVGIVSFSVAGVPAADVSDHLATRHGVAVRDGWLCAHPLARHLLDDASGRIGRPLSGGAVRASLGLGSSIEDVDRLLAGLAEIAGS